MQSPDTTSVGGNDASQYDRDNSGSGKLRVPGFGLPIDYCTQAHFQHGAYLEWMPQRLTVREVAMIRCMDDITDKPDWNRKVFDEDILAKWQSEAKDCSQGLVSEKTFAWCIRELRERAAEFNADGLVRTLEAGYRCIKSDVAISQSLRDEIREAVKPLLEKNDPTIDWHPGSHNQVLDIVHPSLYPFIYGRTRILQEGRVPLAAADSFFGSGAVIREQPPFAPYPAARDGKNLWSTRFQWLPADINFLNHSGTAVRISSYINNLHPVEHRHLYGLIEKVIEKSIPAWNEVLVKNVPRVDVRIRYEGLSGKENESLAHDDWCDTSPWALRDDKKRRDLLENMQEFLLRPDDPSFLPCDDFEAPPRGLDTEPMENWSPDFIRQAYRWKHRRLRKIVHPEPGDAFDYDQWNSGGMEYWVGLDSEPLRRPGRDRERFRLEDQFRTLGLQIIVKLASIELNPQVNRYPGGSWHLEGMLNEHIVATAIYYYDVENCTSSRLGFRQEAQIEDAHYISQGRDPDPIVRIMGIEHDQEAVQEIGSIDTREGRLLVFPNTLQHQVSPFELVDHTKPGHRRFLVLWLVDPHYRIISTANVPPQRLDWWRKLAWSKDWNKRLPAELTNQVLSYVEADCVSLDEAKELMRELMEERTAHVTSVHANFERYNLCEH